MHLVLISIQHLLNDSTDFILPFANFSFSESNTFNDDDDAHLVSSARVKTAFSKRRTKTSSKSDDVSGYVVLAVFKFATISGFSFTFPSK